MSTLQTEAAAPRTPEDYRAMLVKQGHRFNDVPQPLLDAKGRVLITPKKLGPRYLSAFQEYARKGANPDVSAALYEGSEPGGGYAVPITMAGEIATIEPTGSDIRSIATVIPTDKNLLLPTTAPAGMPITELTTELVEFSGTFPSPTFAQTELQAWMNAISVPLSLQLTEDQPALAAWAVNQVEPALLEQEDSLFVSGTGSNQPQGLIGNVGSGITAEPDSNNNMVSVPGLSALMTTLKPRYLKNASWLMNPATAQVIRQAQITSSVFFPVWSRDSDGTDRLFGYPVKYSASMPTAARGNAPVLFGDFKAGYIIGDRGGSALRLKVIDQLLATTGTLWWLLYRRTDARVWVQEAIQQYNVALS
jgi:HK97 family phage major capsid protein